MEASARDAGLVRALGPWSLAASILNMVVGASIFVVPAALAGNLGAYAWVAIIGCAVAMGAVAICFAEGGSRLPSSGGAYAYIEAAFGPLAAYSAGTLLWVSNALACGGIAVALADVAVTVLPAPAAMFHAAVIVATITLVTAVNLGGVARATRWVNVVALAKVLPLVLFVVIGAFAIRSANFHAPTAFAGFGRAAILAVFAFMGMETSLCASGEVRNPERNIPRALGLAMLSVTLLYAAIQIVAQGILGTALAASAAPLVDAAGRLHPALRLTLLAGAAASMFGYVCTDILSTPRILFAFARDGLLPRVLGHTHRRTHVPHVAIVCYAALGLGLGLTGTFAELAVLSTLAAAAFYVMGCAASWRLKRRGVAQGEKPLAFRWLGAAAAIGIGSMLLLIALGSREEIEGLAALIGLSIAMYAVQTRVAGRGRGAVKT